MPQRETYRKTLEQAAAIAGGELNLSVRLKVPMSILQNWLAGSDAVPDDVFLAAVDLISAEKLRPERPSSA
jgi:hypothetical protein